LSIWPDNRACPGHNTESIAIAIKSKANLCIARLNRGDKILEVFRMGGIRMVIGEMSIDLTI
jgi:hypothetical protein